MTSINKIYVDSRFKTTDSRSNTDFRMQLNEPLVMADRTVAMIGDIVVPHAIYTIEYFNQYLYVRMTGIQDSKIAIPRSNYDIFSLAAVIKDGLNNAFGPNSFETDANEALGVITISILSDNTFEVFTNQQLANLTVWSGQYYDKSNPMTCNEVLSNTINNGPYSLNKPFVSGFINCSVHSLYLCSSSFGFNQIGPRGERNIIKKILVNGDFGSILTNHINIDDEFSDVSRRTLQTLDFQLTDVYGNVIDLHGLHISFTVILRNRDNTDV